MLITFRAGKKGWTEYVLFNNGKRVNEEVKIIDGNPLLTKEIYESTNYKNGNYTSGIISFDDENISEEKIKKIYEDWKQEFFKGYDNDEFNISAVLHTNTKKKHIHFCIPIKNLLTETQNNYYLHKTDLKRATTLQTYLNKKYDETDPTEIHNSKLKKDHYGERKLEIINEWRKHQGKKSYKNELKEITKQLDLFLYKEVEMGNIDCFEDIEEQIKMMDLKIVNQGWEGSFTNKEKTEKDIKFFKITIQADDGKKITLKGDIYGTEKGIWRNCKEGPKSIKLSRAENRVSRTNKSNINGIINIDERSSTEADNGLSNNDKGLTRARTTELDELYKELTRENNKRAKYLNGRVSNSRKNKIRENINKFQENTTTGAKSEQVDVKPINGTINTIAGSSSVSKHKFFLRKKSFKRKLSDSNRAKTISRFKNIQTRNKFIFSDRREQSDEDRRWGKSIPTKLIKGNNNDDNTNTTKDKRNDGGNGDRRQAIRGNIIKQCREHFERTNGKLGNINKEILSFEKRRGAARARNDNTKTEISRTGENISRINQKIRDGGIKMNKEVELFKQDISLVDFMEIVGGATADESTNNHLSKVVDYGNCKFIVSKSENNHYQYFNAYDSSDSGTIVDFYKNHINPKAKFYQIMIELRKYNKKGYPSKRIIEGSSSINRNVLIDWHIAKKMKEEDILKLSKFRNIDIDTIKEFEDVIRIDHTKYDNFVFPLNRFLIVNDKLKTDIIGVENKNKAIEAGGENFNTTTGKKGLWGKIIGEDINKAKNKIFLFESTFDAMAYRELKGVDGTYISLGGGISKEQLIYLDNLINKQAIKEIITCFDNDTLGDKYRDNLQERYTHLNVKNDISQSKDWNDDLKNQKEYGFINFNDIKIFIENGDELDVKELYIENYEEKDILKYKDTEVASYDKEKNKFIFEYNNVCLDDELIELYKEDYTRKRKDLR